MGSGDGKVVTNILTNIWPKLVLSRWSKSKSFEIRKNKQLGGGKKKEKEIEKKNAWTYDTFIQITSQNILRIFSFVYLNSLNFFVFSLFLFFFFVFFSPPF